MTHVGHDLRFTQEWIFLIVVRGQKFIGSVPGSLARAPVICQHARLPVQGTTCHNGNTATRRVGGGHIEYATARTHYLFERLR